MTSAADYADPGHAGSRRPAPRAPRKDRVERTAPRSPRKERMEQTADLLQKAVDAHRGGDFDTAELLYRKVLALEPHDAIALNDLGILLVQRGRHEPGEELIRKAVAAKPDYAEAHANLGTLLREKGEIDAAIAAFEQAVTAKPSYAEAHCNLAHAFERKGNTEEAAAAFERAIASRPDYPEAYFGRANALKTKGRVEEAIAAYREAITLKPDFAAAHARLGVALTKAGEIDEAIAAYRRALDLKPENAEAHSNLGIALIEKGETDTAIAEYRQAVALAPNWAHAHFGLSLALLQKGEYAEGWREYEWRWKGAVDKIKPRELPKPQWQGEDLSGKTLLLYAEQGLGDTLQFVRFVPSLAARGARVVLETPGKLLSLLRMAGVAETVVAAGTGLPEFDFHLPLLTLPSVIGLTEESIPADVPYLAADPARVAIWHERLSKGGFRVGVVWQGFPNAEIDKGRSIPLRCFAPLATVPGVSLISLQKNYGLDQLDAMPESMRVATLGPDFDAGPDAFLDTAAVMVDFDLIITSDTSIAHLAGALGRPVWIVLKSNPDWRWLSDREDSAWYPTARLFRQRARGDWDEVMERLAAELARVTAGNIERLFAPGKMPSSDDRVDRARSAFDRGFALHRDGSLDAAAAAYCKAVTLDPNHAEAYSNIGVIRHGHGRIDEAITLYRRAVAIKPDHVSALDNLAVALTAKGDVDGAIAALRQAVAAKPEDADRHLRLGDLLRRKDDTDGAVAAYRQAAVIRPDDPKAQFSLAFGLQKKGEVEAAIEGYRQAIALDPKLAQAHANLGVALSEADRVEEGIAECRQALTLQPDNPQYHSNLGLALSKADDLDAALEHFLRAVEIDPDHAEGHANLALALLEKGILDEAIACDRRAIQLKPDYAEAHFVLSLALLMKGEFAAGWQEYEWRWKGGVKELKAQGFAQPRWRGEDLAGKTLLLHAEQGLGDTLQFARFARALAARGARIILAVPRELVTLLRSTPGVEAVIGAGENLVPYDFHLPLMSVPSVLGTTEKTIPANVPYLAADPERIAFWRARLSAGFKVGIVWQGRPDAKIDKGRSVSLRAFAPIASVPGVQLISLQKNNGLDQLADLPEGMRVQTLGPNFDVGSDAFLDSAALMMNLDLVITSDTSIAHLAGALGRPVWIVLKSNPDWRWLVDREDSPWYPTARLFRQRRRGDWDEVFQRVAEELARIVRGKRGG
jgi:tetratricopeptide (TPR) repeat protein